MRRACIMLGTCAVVAACATAPAPEPVAPPPPPPPPVAVAEPACPVCVDRSDEMARLRQELATRDAELKELRTSQREQAKAVQESTREVTRARARQRRLATQADAASYLAEVEVAIEASRALPQAAQSPLLALAQSFLDAAQQPFAQADYGAAMDRAAQAEQLVAAVADGTPAAVRSRATGEVLLQVSIPLKAGVDSRLRRQPGPRAPVVASLRKDAALVAHAYRGAWMRVETEDGKFGWMRQAELAAR
jgi:type IV secretory pathway VirB10-like protein